MDDTNDKKVVPEVEETEEFVETNEEGEELSGQAAVKKLREKLKEAVAEKQKYLDNWQRDKAEFINARRRDEEAKAEFLKFANQGFVEELLPIIDSFELSLSHNIDGEGVKAIYQQLISMLKKFEIEPFGQKGDAFDAVFHHAIGTVPVGEGDADHTIAEVLQKGYKMSNKVIRPALIKVFQK